MCTRFTFTSGGSESGRPTKWNKKEKRKKMTLDECRVVCGSSRRMRLAMMMMMTLFFRINLFGTQDQKNGVGAWSPTADTATNLKTNDDKNDEWTTAADSPNVKGSKHTNNKNEHYRMVCKGFLTLFDYHPREFVITFEWQKIFLHGIDVGWWPVPLQMATCVILSKNSHAHIQFFRKYTHSFITSCGS